jgi:hypothetical protein
VILWTIFTGSAFLIYYIPARILSIICTGGDRCPICNAKM